MLLRKLRLKNFKSYEDEVVFDFSTDEYKNIILIGGKNGAGKSSIFESIKLCIYGPLAYRYQGSNTTYIAKIKSNINNNAFKNDTVTSFISIDIELEEGSDKNIYTLTRTWTFKDTKLNETFVAYKNYNSIPLTEEELYNFENYLKSILSPKIFDFFFFDGEQLSEFFIGKNSSMHLKESFLSLCNYDTFEVLKNRIITSNRGKGKHTNLIDQYKDDYLSCEVQCKDLKEQQSALIEAIDKIDNNLKNLTTEKNSLEKKFKKQGGLLADERESLTQELIVQENIRSDINTIVKNFSNDILPFFIVKDKLSTIKKQIETENTNATYKTIKAELDSSSLENILPKIFNNHGISFHKDLDSKIPEISNDITTSLKEQLRPESYDDNHKPIHQLSQDNSNLVLSRICELENSEEKHLQDVDAFYAHYKRADETVKKINYQLNTSLNNDEVNEFLSEINKINNSIASNEQLKNSKEMNLFKVEEELEKALVKTDKAKVIYHSLIKENNVHDVSMEMIELLGKIIVSLTSEKINEIEKNFMHIFNKIIRKDKFIDSINIDNNFNVTLYIDKKYTYKDVQNLLSNIGTTEIDKKLGDLFFKDLYSSLNVENINEAKPILVDINNENNSINLRTKVDVGGFSNGEKQIYILCIYWSLVKASGINIPFVIDTPYARIDESHRNNITTDYFSSISNQVIILSTNTEINEPAYRQLKDIISHEYLIEYDDINRKTNKTEGYFFEV